MPHHANRSRLLSLMLLCLLPVLLAGTCGKRRQAVDEFPAGTLHVRYLAAADYTECLVATVAMCGNYVLDSPRFTPVEIRDGLAAQGLDHTRIGDLRMWLASEGVEMIPLRGDLSSRPPVGLAWWVLARGYPVICVVNKHAGNAEYNHAVLVIGLDFGETGGSPDAVYLLDPASPKRVERWDRLRFQHYWGSAGRVMLPMFESPERPEAVVEE